MSSIVEKIVPLVKGSSKFLKYKEMNPPIYVIEFASPNSKPLPMVSLISSVT